MRRRLHVDKAPGPVAAGQEAEVLVAVIDSGVDAHHEAVRGFVAPGWNVLCGCSDVSDTTGHGTAVASVLVDVVRGASVVEESIPRVWVMPVKVTDENGNTTPFRVAQAIDWALRRGAKVVNVSFEDVLAHPEVQRAAQRLHRNGGLLVVAAGNRGQRQVVSAGPAVVRVAAVDQSDRLAKGSGHGLPGLLAAPGVDVPVAVARGQWGVATGTSFAAPAVAAVAALAWTQWEQAVGEDIRALLFNTAEGLSAQGPSEETGHGMARADRAMTAARAQRQLVLESGPALSR